MNAIEWIISPGLMIRSVSTADVDALLGLYGQCEDFLSLGPTPKASREMVLSDLRHSESESGNYCGIYHNGQLVGVIDWIPLRKESGTAFVNLVMIDRNCRRKGLGSRALETVEARISSDPAAVSIETAVQINNEPALRFWNRQGYEAISGPIRNDDGTTVFLLRKPVRS